MTVLRASSSPSLFSAGETWGGDVYSGPATGLFSSPNPFSQAPAGTLRTADDVRFTAPGVIEPRRGFRYIDNGVGSSASRFDSFAFYAATTIAAYDLTKVSLYTSSWSDFTGAFVPNGTNRMRFEGAARSVFFNPTTGIRVFDGTGQPSVAGCPQGLNATIVNASANGWQSSNTAVAYRFTICRKDAFSRVIEGPPSGRTILRNSVIATAGNIARTGAVMQVVTGGVTDAPNNLQVGDVFTLSPGETDFSVGPYTIANILGPNAFNCTVPVTTNAVSTLDQTVQITRAATVTCWLPVDTYGGVTTDNFVRVYRSEMTATASDTPTDELFLVFETPYLSATNLSNGYVVAADTAPESTIGFGVGAVALYTNANADGQDQANYRPPIAEDMVYWASRMWYANTTEKESLHISLIGCGSPDGLQANDTIAFLASGGSFPGDLTTYTAVDSATPGAYEFQVFTDGDPGYNIERTAKALCQLINTSVSDPPMYALYVSAEGGLPGQIHFVAQGFGSVFGFSVYSNRPTAWTPQLPDTTTPLWTAPASANDRHAARLKYSRLGQPEAVPLDNYEEINSDNDAILRIFPLHYRLLVFKTDGIYTCTNLAPFTITRLSAYKLLAPDSVCVLEDRVYALTDQGLVTISDSGLVQISNPIDDIFNELMSPSDIATVAARAFAVAYRSERQVILWVPQLNSDGSVASDNSQAFVFSTLSGGFTRYSFGARCAAINPTTNVLTFAPTDSNLMCGENKTLTLSDYYDLAFALGPPVSVSSAAVTFSASVAARCAVGDVLSSSSGDHYPILSISGVVVTLSGAPGWTGATNITLYKAISCEVEFNKMTDGRPADLKLVGQVSLLFRENGVHDTSAIFSSENATDPVDVTLSGIGWGEFEWGSAPYGSPTQQIRRIEPIPSEVAQAAQLSVGFSTSEALQKFAFLGIDVVEAEDTPTNYG